MRCIAILVRQAIGLLSNINTTAACETTIDWEHERETTPSRRIALLAGYKDEHGESESRKGKSDRQDLNGFHQDKGQGGASANCDESLQSDKSTFITPSKTCIFNPEWRSWRSRTST